MKYSVFLFLMCLGFAIEPSYIQEMVNKQTIGQLSEFKSFNIEIIQSPYGADKVSQEGVSIDSLEIKPGITVVNVNAVVDGKKTILRYLAKVRVFDNVLVLKETAVSNREFDSRIAEGRVEEVTALFDAGKNWVKTADEAKGQRFLRTVKKGSILLREALEKIPEVKKNDVVSVVIKEGEVELSCNVVALEDGYIGNTIVVMHSQYKKKLFAVVQGTGMLEIKG